MAKKRARGDSAASVEPASKKAKGAGSKATEPASAPDSVKVYAWCFEDMPFEDYRVFVATSSEDLEKLRTWKPKDQDDDEGLPTLMALEFVHHDSLEEDVKGKSRGIAGLFAPFIAEDHEFLLYSDGEPDSALMEITLVKKLPRKGPFSAVDVGTVAHSDLDGFEPVPGHELKEQGYSWVTSVRVERDIEIIRSVQKLVRAHSDGVDTLLEDNKVEASTPAETVLGDVPSGLAEDTAEAAKGANAQLALPDTAKEVGHGQTKPKTVKLYLWTYDAEEFEDNRYLPAVDADELKAFENWQPNNRDDDSGLPGLIAAELPYHKSLQRDVKDRSRDISKLFDVFVNADNGSGISFCMFYEGDPEHVLLEATLSLTKPITGPFVEVKLITAMHDQVDNFYPWPGKPHPLYQQGYRYIVSTRVEDDPKILRLSQKLDRNHALGLEVDGDDLDDEDF